MPYGRGFGFRGSSAGWPYIGRGRGGLPRCWGYGPNPYGAAFGTGSFGYAPWYAPAMPGEDEKRVLQQEVDFLKQQLGEVSEQIQALEQKSQEEK